MKLGQMVMTRGIAAAMNESDDFAIFISKSLTRYVQQDWGDLCAEDKQMNDSAIKNLDDRVLAKYNHPDGNIYIITEWDGSATTVLFCDEY